ncbi:MAG: hypothetical protein COX62_00955 [Deltaproteobacteria bacterium CG_4_10_14_0_2_um_filter_43_8]|nr:MAG: hypothetical protein COV43_01210 [Deltaproteobacteria bacterium CG11_big_fil_rev_8_21_14_0_20_42_23]PJA22006.1 MAG: hypothetical protein COX62_00955 [Deltaproteobacteria bacterium CG_4_10_14_0_2_um_filter_43_8]PJC63533.1 MAG: hypothetical protein CO021_08785 [Deltaproteobacteria bacterium CG_4_9_14_0_2_um_filter_42_21]
MIHLILILKKEAKKLQNVPNYGGLRWMVFSTANSKSQQVLRLSRMKKIRKSSFHFHLKQNERSAKKSSFKTSSFSKMVKQQTRIFSHFAHFFLPSFLKKGMMVFASDFFMKSAS